MVEDIAGYWIDDGVGWCGEDFRRRSGEVDFGVLWCLDGKPWPHYRISWIRDTGELYAIEQGNFVEIGPDLDRMVYLLGIYRARHTVEAAMRGWCEHRFRIGPFVNGISHE